MTIVKRFNTALQDGLPKTIFDHLRNYLIGAFILAIGTHELRHNIDLAYGLVPGKYAGMAVIGIAFLLIGLNLYDGIRQLSKYRFHLLVTLGLLSVYVLVSIRIVEIAWNFRSSC